MDFVESFRLTLSVDHKYITWASRHLACHITTRNLELDWSEIQHSYLSNRNKKSDAIWRVYGEQRHVFSPYLKSAVEQNLFHTIKSTTVQLLGCFIKKTRFPELKNLVANVPSPAEETASVQDGGKTSADRNEEQV